MDLIPTFSVPHSHHQNSQDIALSSIFITANSFTSDLRQTGPEAPGVGSDYRPEQKQRSRAEATGDANAWLG